MKDFYYILGTDVNCTSIEVKEAYRKLSKKFHPDLNQNDKYFENRFREIQEAYEVLNDPLKRKQYDTALNRFKSSQQNTRTSTGESYKTRPSAITKTRRGIDVLFTIILIVITGVFGAYVFKAINAADTVKPKQINTAVATVPVVKPKHHKKRHFVKPEIIADVTKVITPIKPFKHDTLKTHPVQIARVEPKPVKIIAVSNNFLYTTTVKSNVTGIVNMREQDNLSSEVVEAIPGNSQVAVIEKGDRYYKVRYNNNTGYIPKWTLQVK